MINRFFVFKLFFLILILLFSLLFYGCIATSDEVYSLRQEVVELRKEIKEVIKSQKDINLRMQELDANLQIYTEKLEENKYKMSFLSQRMDDVYSSLSQKMDILSKQLPKVDTTILPLPTEFFNMAYNDYSKGMFDLAIRGFKDYLLRYPDSELANKAYYYLADSYYTKKNYQECIKVIDEYLSKYKKDEFLVNMLYMKAKCLDQLNMNKQANEIYKYIKEKYPNSPQAKELTEE